MGYWKDNFPGSPAYYLRRKFAVGVVLYSVVAGGLIFYFSSLSKRLENWFPQKEEGPAANQFANPILFYSHKDVDRFRKEHDRHAHQDHTRPMKWEGYHGLLIGNKAAAEGEKQGRDGDQVKKD